MRMPQQVTGKIGANSLAVGAGPLLILTHDNPDPDALASGKTCCFYLSRPGVFLPVAYSGLVTRRKHGYVAPVDTRVQPLEAIGEWGDFQPLLWLIPTGAGNNTSI